tara:strand:+ start:33842 stop:34021 length:180 start_codon:yes stop_codon:yes gene_type:complete
MKEENKFSTEWLKDTMEDQGRTYIWLAKKLGISPYVLNYKKKKDVFLYEEEKKIMNLLQ